MLKVIMKLKNVQVFQRLKLQSNSDNLKVELSKYNFIRLRKCIVSIIVKCYENKY